MILKLPQNPLSVSNCVEITRRSEGSRELGASYLWRVGHSAVIDEIRKHRRRGETPLDDQGAEVDPIDPSPDPEDMAAAVSLGRGIIDCLGSIAAARRQAVTLHLQGHQVPEIARLLGWKVKRAENLVYRGLADLRLCLRRKGLKP